MVEVSELGGTGVRGGGADELPGFVGGVVAHVQDGLAALEDLAGLDAGGAQQPVPHPPRAPVAFHDEVDHPPDERQVLVGASLLRGQVRAALGYPLERLVDERERVAVLVLEHHGVERATAGIAGADPDRQPGHLRIRAGGPAERVRGQLAARPDELAERAAVHARDVGRRHLDERALPYLDVHRANVVDLAAPWPAGYVLSGLLVSSRVLSPLSTRIQPVPATRSAVRGACSSWSWTTVRRQTPSWSG